MGKRRRHQKKTLVITDENRIGGNYMEQNLKIVDEIQAPGLRHVQVLHDDWCKIFRGAACNCDPKVVLLTEEEGKKKYGR
jgi:hypothetical protein